MSSVVGPTIKPGSRIDSYFPSIAAAEKSRIVNNEGTNEPILRSLSNAIEEGDAREIDGIHFWSAIESSNSIAEQYKRRLSLSMADQAAKMQRSNVGSNMNGGRDTSMTNQSKISRASNSLRNQKDLRTSKQDLCTKLDKLANG